MRRLDFASGCQNTRPETKATGAAASTRIKPSRWSIASAPAGTPTPAAAPPARNTATTTRREVVYCICSRRDAHARGRAPCPQHSDDDSPDCLCSFLFLAITPPDSDAGAPSNRYSVTYSGAKRGPDAAAPAIVVTPQCPAPAQAPHSWAGR
ncbi:hypothetical protein MAJ_05985, partial [Metarhizium majus ARSEF 297]